MVKRTNIKKKVVEPEISEDEIMEVEPVKVKKLTKKKTAPVPVPVEDSDGDDEEEMDEGDEEEFELSDEDISDEGDDEEEEMEIPEHSGSEGESVDENADNGEFNPEDYKDFKPMFLTNEDDEDDEDSDRELQIALKEGLLKGDALHMVVEKNRPIINKTAEIKKKLALMKKNLPWIETIDVTTEKTLDKHIMKDDFEREVHIYKQAERAAAIAVPRLLAMKVKVFRPEDYYAQMAKSDEHMQKVRKRLLEVQEGKEKQEAIRRMREEKKFASKVQREVLAGREKEKKDLNEAVKKHRKGMKQQLDVMLSNAKRLQMEDDDDDRAEPPSSGGARGGNMVRDKKKQKKMPRDVRNKKFGFGGQKKRGKYNTKESFEAVDKKSGGGGRKGRLGGKKGRS